MSDNPFATPSPEPDFHTPSAQRLPKTNSPPGALTTIAIICLILGIFGLLGSCMGAASLGFMSSGMMETMLEGVPDDSPDMEIQRLSMEAQKGALLPSLILMAINLIVATMLIIGSIGTLQRKEGGRKFFRTALLGAIFYSILKIVINIYIQLITMSAMASGIENYEGEADKAGLEMIAGMTKMFAIVGIVIGAVIGLVLLGFYVWSRGYLNKENVIAYFNADTAKAY